jgi:probable HAF family extracellular repeat protein
MRKTMIAALLLAAIAPATLPASDDVFFMELPPETLPYGIGANAFGIVGAFFSGGGLTWMPTSGTVSIGGNAAIAVSRDGKTVIGRAVDARGLENAAVWQGGQQWRLLGSFTPDAQPCDALLSSAFGASDDGKVIVGLGWDGCRFAHAFRWEEATGMVDLGSTVSGRSSRANDVSGDGRVVVGWQEDATGPRLGAKWNGRQQELLRGPNGPVGEAFDANRDGSLIVGTHCDLGATVVRSAWTWTASNGVRCFPVQRPATLPNLPYSVQMAATSDNGRVIGGAFTFGLDSESLLWLNGKSHFLKDFLREHGYVDAFRDWVNTGFITNVSGDGRTLVGFGAGRRTFQGFMVILPEQMTR